MTRVVLIEKDKKFLQYWKLGSDRGIFSTTLTFKCMWCDEFTHDHIPVIGQGEDFHSYYGVCKQCSQTLEPYWKF